MSHRRTLVAVLSVLVTGSLAPTAGAAPCAGADLVPSGAPAKARAATLCLLNRERANHGLRPLRPNRLLALAARRHGRDMVARHYFAHDSLDGRTFDTRIKATGYLAGANGWAIGENLAWGAGSMSTPRAIVIAWMASPPHRHNILTRAYTRIGIALTPGAPAAGVDGPAETYTTEFGHRG